MFKIALMYEGLDHSDLISQYKDCINLLMCLDDNIKKFMNENFIETAETRKVTKLMMDPSVTKLVFWSNTAQLNAETIQENLKAENRKLIASKAPLAAFFDYAEDPSILVEVKVHIIRVDWLRGNVLNFYRQLNNPSLSIANQKEMCK